jgi:hypothetical protein
VAAVAAIRNPAVAAAAALVAAAAVVVAALVVAEAAAEASRNPAVAEDSEIIINQTYFALIFQVPHLCGIFLWECVLHKHL